MLRRHVRQPIVANQVQLSLLHHHLISDGIVANTNEAVYQGTHGTLEYCRIHDIMIQAWSPLARGEFLSPPEEADATTKDVAEELNQVAQAHSTDPACVALAWLLRHPANIQPIVGTLKESHLRTLVDAVNVELTRSQWYRLLAAARGAGVP